VFLRRISQVATIAWCLMPIAFWFFITFPSPAVITRPAAQMLITDTNAKEGLTPIDKHCNII
jgi:hypothetical protein